jgi:hypothetical protein
MSPKDPSELSWQPLGAVRGEELARAWVEAHWAIQILAAVGYTHIEAADDDGQSNAGWVDGMQLLVGRRIEKDPVSFVSLSPARLVLGLHEPGGDPLEELDCAGKTLEEGYEWLSGAIARRFGDGPRPLTRPPYDMPAHGIATGEPFGAATESARSDLARWLHDANLVMRDLRAKTPQATLPRVWPHHFDMGMLISLEADGDAQKGRSIGIGLAAADARFSEPYWYVNPHPAPDGGLSDLRHGRWNRDGFEGFVLETDELLAASDQESACRSFVAEAVEACRQALGG